MNATWANSWFRKCLMCSTFHRHVCEPVSGARSNNSWISEAFELLRDNSFVASVSLWQVLIKFYNFMLAFKLFNRHWCYSWRERWETFVLQCHLHQTFFFVLFFQIISKVSTHCSVLRPLTGFHRISPDGKTTQRGLYKSPHPSFPFCYFSPSCLVVKNDVHFETPVILSTKL